MEQRKGQATGAVTESCCSRGGGHENNNINSDCGAMSDCESDCSQFESSSGAAAATDSANSSRSLMDDDHILNRAEALTLDEVIERRSRRVRKLMKVYKSQYWGLVEEMRTKYRRFYLRHGKSGWRDDEEEREGVDGGGAGGDDGMREPERRAGNSENVHCGAQGCTAKPLQLSVFCFAHILQEPRQRLYKPCSHVIRTGVTCGKPVLRAVVPALCGPHFHQAQRQATRSLNRVLPGGVKFNPKLHLIVAQYVRVIQSKRRAHRAAALAAPAAPAAKAVKVESNGKGVMSSQAGGPPRSSSAAKGTSKAAANHGEKKPLANGQAKQNGVPAKA